MSILETSAKQRINVEEAFYGLVKILINIMLKLLKAEKQQQQQQQQNANQQGQDQYGQQKDNQQSQFNNQINNNNNTSAVNGGVSSDGIIDQNGNGGVSSGQTNLPNQSQSQSQRQQQQQQQEPQQQSENQFSGQNNLALNQRMDVVLLFELTKSSRIFIYLFTYPIDCFQVTFYFQPSSPSL